jgi:hypothetical protein
MRVTLPFNAKFLKSAVAGLLLGGAVVASCTFNPGPAGSAQSTGANPGQGTGVGILGGAGSGSVTGSAGTNGMTGAGKSTPGLDGSNCGLQQYGLENVPPDVLIIFDKSGSMAQQADGSDCPMGGGACMPKWPEATSAINMVVGSTQAQIRWGLKYFPSNNQCATQGTAVPIAANNAAAIAASIGMTNPNGRTPTRTAVSTGAQYLQSLADPNPKYILLVTDGLPNCPPGGSSDTPDPMGAVMAVQASAMAGIPVYVIGVGSIPDGVQALNDMAVAGGRPRMGDPKYYVANNATELSSILTTIGNQITSCSFGLGQVPPVPTNVGVYGDGNKINQDPVNGWGYGAGMRSIELFGTTCEAVKNKTIKNIQAIFGCPGQVVP